jgi:quercetin dioxygenase-like cupin family protein
VTEHQADEGERLSRGHDHPGEVSDLGRVADELIEAAGRSGARRAARTLITVGPLRVTVIGLAAGAALAEHENPGAAVLQVLRGRAVLHTDSREWPLSSGSAVQIPDERHGVRAEEDTAVLLTVALRAGG